MELSKRVIFKAKDGRELRGITLRQALQAHMPQLHSLLTSRGAIQGIIRRACYQGGEMWIRIFLPKRFEMGYARGLGYGSRQSYDAWKAKNVGRLVSFGQDYVGELDTKAVTIAGPQPQPFVLSGASKQSALSTARVAVTMTGGDLSNLKMRVGFQAGAINRGRNHAAFVKLPATEYIRVVAEIERVFRRELMPMVQSGQITNKYRFSAPRTGAQAFAARQVAMTKQRSV